MIKYKRENSGITLISLVVTIIVLLILAGIAIMMLIGNNSILKKADDAKVETNHGEVLEAMRLEAQNYYIENNTTGNIESELKQKYSFENINIVGELPHDVAMDKINDSDIFILPSYTEGFPNVILEAMHLGKAIIATNVGAIPEILGNNTGIVINAKSVKDIIDSLELLINNANLKVEYSKKAKEESKQYLLENVLKTYTKVWFDR